MAGNPFTPDNFRRNSASPGAMRACSRAMYASTFLWRRVTLPISRSQASVQAIP